MLGHGAVGGQIVGFVGGFSKLKIILIFASKIFIGWHHFQYWRYSHLGVLVNAFVHEYIPCLVDINLLKSKLREFCKRISLYLVVCWICCCFSHDALALGIVNSGST